MFSNKTAVIGIVEKKKDSGQIKALATKQANATVALPFLRSSIADGTVVHSDESHICTGVKRTFDHEFVNHSKLEYSRAGVHTNTGVLSGAKQDVTAKYPFARPCPYSNSACHAKKRGHSPSH
jgi:hypothetical protein